MESQDVKRDHLKPEAGEQAYEPPEATVVQVQLEERVLGCLYSSIQVCGLTC